MSLVWTAIGANWKSILALAGAATVGAAGGAYWTLPRSVADIRAEQQHQGEQLDALEDAVLANTRAIRLVSCVQSARFLSDRNESDAQTAQCIARFGLR